MPDPATPPDVARCPYEPGSEDCYALHQRQGWAENSTPHDLAATPPDVEPRTRNYHATISIESKPDVEPSDPWSDLQEIVVTMTNAAWGRATPSYRDARDRFDAALRALRGERERTDDFRAEIVVEAFTAPDADWNTILDSLRARIRDLSQAREKAERALRRIAEYEGQEGLGYETPKLIAVAALTPQQQEPDDLEDLAVEGTRRMVANEDWQEPERCPNDCDSGYVASPEGYPTGEQCPDPWHQQEPREEEGRG